MHVQFLHLLTENAGSKKGTLNGLCPGPLFWEEETEIQEAGDLLNAT